MKANAYRDIQAAFGTYRVNMSMPMATGIRSAISPLSTIGLTIKLHDDRIVGLHDHVADGDTYIEMFRQLEERVVFIQKRENQQGQPCRDPRSQRLIQMVERSPMRHPFRCCRSEK